MQRWFSVAQDTAGNALAGVSISVFTHGTLTPASLFSDNGVTALPNPFTNNTNGTYEFYAANGRYDIVQTKSGYVFPPAQSADILLFDGNVTTPYTNVKDFGAVGNGIANDTVPVQAAITAASAAAGNGTVFFPAGTYLVTTTLTVTAPICLLGATTGVSTVRTGSATANVVHCELANHGFRVSNLNFDTSVTRTAGAYVLVEGVGATENSDTVIDTCRFNAGWIALALLECSRFHVRDCSFFASVSHDVSVNNLITPDSGDGAFVDCNFVAIVGTGDHIVWNGSSGLKVIGCKFSFGARGLVINNPSPTGLGLLLVSASSFEDHTDMGIFLAPAAGASFERVTITGCEFLGINCNEDIHLSNDTRWVTITGNVFDVRRTIAGTQRAILSSTAAANVVIASNTFRVDFSAGTTNCIEISSAGEHHLTNNTIQSTFSTKVIPGTNTRMLDSVNGWTLAQLGATAFANGSLAWCTDCDLATPCGGAGTGAFAKRLAATWDCD